MSIHGEHPMTDSVVSLNALVVARAHKVSRAAGGLVMLTGALALAGWIFDVSALKSLYGNITIKPNAAVSLLAAGLSLWLLTVSPAQPWRALMGKAGALLTAAIGIATFSEHLVGWDLSIDQLLFSEEAGAAATTSPGRMGPPASVCFGLAGISLSLLYRQRATLLAQVCAAAIALLALLAITGYAYGATALYGVAQYTGISLKTAIALLALGIGLLASSVDRGIASIVAGRGAGSLLARRMLAPAVVVPLLLGWARVSMEREGYIDSTFGIAAFVLVLIVILIAVVARTAIVVNRIEQQQLAAEATVRERLHELEAMMEVLPIGVFIAKSRDVTDITGNSAAREFLRMPEAHGNLSLSAPDGEAPRHFRILRGGVEVPAEDLPVQRAARDGTTTRELEFDVEFSDGTVKRELISARPLLDERGRPRGAVGAILDITARRAAEQEREILLAREREARAEAEAANSAKDDFLATISHELRTPLHAILGWASMLREGTLDDRTRQRALEAIERNSKSQAQLIDDLLDISRVVAGNLRLDVKPVDLAPIIEAAIETVRPAADAKRIRVRTVVDPAARAVNGDAARLQQVVWNLLANAVKFSAENGTVEVQLEAGGADAVISVVDDGEGIDPAFLPFVFDRFRQADSKQTRRHGGVGIGLSIAQSLMELHGGSISAFSDGVGCGARFVVRLPLLASTEAAAPVMVTSTSAT